jgi:predicted transcriptional regulator
VIAEPNERALRDFTHIRDVLLRPPKVVPRFGGKVLLKQAQDPVGDAVVAMREGSYSQVPIISGQEVKSVLTTDTVSRWLAHESSNDLVSLLETRIEDVLPHTEDPEHYAVLSQDATLVDVLGVFEDFVSRGKVLNAILISSSGQPKLPLVGILTVHDLPAVLSSLQLQRSSLG